MKKVILFLAIALFVSAGVVTATKIQSVSANVTAMGINVDNSDASAVVIPGNDDKKKNKEAKDSKTVKAGAEKTNDFGTKKCCDEGAAKCCDKGAKKSCDEGAKKCCDEGAKKSCDKDKK